MDESTRQVFEMLREADKLNEARGVATQHARLWRTKRASEQVEALAYHKAMVERDRSITQTSAAMEAARRAGDGHSARELEFLEEIEREVTRRSQISAKIMNAKYQAIFAQATEEHAKRLERKKKLSDNAARMRRVKAQQAARKK